MIYRFGDFALDSRRCELTVGGVQVHLEPQVFDVLRFLVENRERVVSRDELVESVWHGRVVSEATIGARVFAARQAVGDTGEAQAVIRTLPRRGFRFVASVEAKDSDEVNPTASDSAPEARPDPPWRPRFRPLAVSTGLVLLLFAALVLSSQHVQERWEDTSPDGMAYPLPRKPSIAVLPFTNLGSEAARDSMGEGLTESLVSVLGSNPFLFVIANSSTDTYADQPSAAKRAANELGVRYVLEGSVRRTGDDVRVTTQLVDALAGQVLWSGRYERQAEAFFSLDTDITAEIARNLDIRINFGTEGMAGGTHSLDSWTAYVQGRNEYDKFALASNARAREHFSRAIEIDPGYAEAMIALAKTHFVEMGLQSAENWESHLASIAELQERAERIAPRMPQLFELRSLLALTRGDYLGALDEAEACVALYPAGAESNYLLGEMAFFNAQYERAIQALQAAERASPNNRASYSSHLAFSHVALGRIDEAVSILEAVVERWPEYAPGHAYLAILYQLGGRQIEARRKAELLPHIAPQMTMLAIERRFSPMQDRSTAARIIEAASQAGIPVQSPI